MLTQAFIPYRGYYSTPFTRWQGSLANEHSIQLGAKTSKRFFESKGWNPLEMQYVLVGSTVYQKQWFYSGPWAAALMGATEAPGVLINQACSTSAFSIYQAGMGLETGLFEQSWCLLADRCSNGPHAIWPNPNGPGGQVIAEDWVMDNFGRDPWAGEAMIQTAENVAKEFGLTRGQCDALTLRRQEQYQQALAKDREFQ
ncbi:MAG: thiolase family protein, partial [Acidobacteriota bacterium]|nr:thiolase family protein [Acidobacteriota bacterium]